MRRERRVGVFRLDARGEGVIFVPRQGHALFTDAAGAEVFRVSDSGDNPSIARATRESNSSYDIFVFKSKISTGLSVEGSRPVYLESGDCFGCQSNNVDQKISWFLMFYV